MSQARAFRRVMGLINLVWQLPDALSGSSPPSLSRSHIPVSLGPITSMIYSLENGERRGTSSELWLHFFSWFTTQATLYCSAAKQTYLPVPEMSIILRTNFAVCCQIHSQALRLHDNCREWKSSSPRVRKLLKRLCI